MAIENRQTSLRFLAVEFSPYKLHENLISGKERLLWWMRNKMLHFVVGRRAFATFIYGLHMAI